MYKTYLFSFAILAVYFFVSPDTTELSMLLLVRVQTFVLNCNLFIRSYWIYRKIAKELRAAGLEPPPFSFVPIQYR